MKWKCCNKRGSGSWGEVGEVLMFCSKRNKTKWCWGCARCVRGSFKANGALLKCDSVALDAILAQLHVVVCQGHTEQWCSLMRCSQLSRNLNTGRVSSQICSWHWTQSHWTSLRGQDFSKGCVCGTKSWPGSSNSEILCQTVCVHSVTLPWLLVSQLIGHLAVSSVSTSYRFYYLVSLLSSIFLFSSADAVSPQTSYDPWPKFLLSAKYEGRRPKSQEAPGLQKKFNKALKFPEKTCKWPFTAGTSL